MQWGHVGSPAHAQAGDFLRRFGAEDVERLMEAMNGASAKVWRGRPKAERRLATIDVDGTIVDTTGQCKEDMDIAYNGRWGFGPLVVSLAESQEVLWALNRPGIRYLKRSGLARLLAADFRGAPPAGRSIDRGGP